MYTASMVVDILLKLLGRNPSAFNDSSKWSAVIASLLFYGAPIFLLLLFISPFLYIWFHSKKFNLKSIIIGVITGFILVAIGVYAMYWAFLLLGSLAVYSLYGGTI